MSSGKKKAKGRQLESSAPAPVSHQIRLDLVLVVVAVALAAFGGYWFLLRSGGVAATTTSQSNAVAVSEKGLSALASAGRPIYWASARDGYTYELTQVQGGGTFVRYLPAGTKIGDAAVHLTVGTYPITNAYEVTKRIAAQSGSVAVPVGGGAVAFYHRELPTNVYLAVPGSDNQVEVFDPDPAEARSLVTQGKIVAVTPSARTGSAAPKAAAAIVQPETLSSLATSLNHPVYWAGQAGGKAYELTETSDGRVYLRYLPLEEYVGTSRPYLTVGTYTLKNAFDVTQKASKQPGSVAIAVDGGGVAFYRESMPTSVYLAFPGIDAQIEVFDPQASAVHDLVQQGRITPVS